MRENVAPVSAQEWGHFWFSTKGDGYRETLPELAPAGYTQTNAAVHPIDVTR
jgi:hypothetical protein